MRPSKQEINSVAIRATSVLTSLGLQVCLFGSAACSLYGTNRVPNDVDIVVLTPGYDPEQLKRMLVAADSASFYLTPSKALNQTYKIAWCRLKNNPHISRNRKCKVDILVPGILNIPHVPLERLVALSGVYVVPFSALLLLKLQGWNDHRTSTRSDFVEKQYTDVQDILDMLRIARRIAANVTAETWIPDLLMRNGERYVTDFVTKYHNSISDWYSLGFTHVYQ